MTAGRLQARAQPCALCLRGMKRHTFTSSCMWRSSCACAGLASSLAPICSSALHRWMVSCEHHMSSFRRARVKALP